MDLQDIFTAEFKLTLPECSYGHHHHHHHHHRLAVSMNHAGIFLRSSLSSSSSSSRSFNERCRNVPTVVVIIIIPQFQLNLTVSSCHHIIIITKYSPCSPGSFRQSNEIHSGTVWLNAGLDICCYVVYSVTTGQQKVKRKCCQLCKSLNSKGAGTVKARGGAVGSGTALKDGG